MLARPCFFGVLRFSIVILPLCENTAPTLLDNAVSFLGLKHPLVRLGTKTIPCQLVTLTVTLNGSFAVQILKLRAFKGLPG